MSESSRTINHKLNELLSKSRCIVDPLKPQTNPDNIAKTKLDASTALAYASVLKANILGKDKQEKVNSIVVLAKLLDCILGSESVSNEFSKVLDHTVFSTLFSIVSPNMSTETYKAILKILVILISGSIFRSKTDSIENYLPLYESLIEYLDVIDIMTQKLYLQDNKITYNSIKLVTDLINKALLCGYDGIITLAGRLKHVTFFSTVGNLIETDDKSILDSISHLKLAYFSLNEYLNATHFDLSIKSHQVMLNNLFIFLEVSLNEYGTVATTEEYVKAGFTDDPRNFVVENFTVLLAMDLKIFVKDPNFTFKKRFHEELMMSDHNRTFPIVLFIKKATDLWLKIFHLKAQYPHIYSSILSWELMIYYTMNNCLVLWQETKSRLENPQDVDSIMDLLESQVTLLEEDLGKGTKSVEECLDVTSRDIESLRQVQIQKVKDAHSLKWATRLVDFDLVLASEVMDFVCEQRVVQLLKGAWVYTEAHGERMLKSSPSLTMNNKYYFIMLSPNRKAVYYKEFLEKSLTNPTYEDMEEHAIPLARIVDFKTSKAGEHVGEQDKKNNSMLVSVKGTISHENIVLVGANGEHLLSFYTDTQVSKYVWLDGLKMLKGMWAGRLSDDTEKQVEALIEMRKNTQLLDLEEKEMGGELEYDYESDEDDEEFYDLAELVTVTEEFHYK